MSLHFRTPFGEQTIDVFSRIVDVPIPALHAWRKSKSKKGGEAQSQAPRGTPGPTAHPPTRLTTRKDETDAHAAWLMPPRRQPQRKAQNAAAKVHDPEVLAKRTKRHLDELERSNYSEPSLGLAGAEDEGEAGGSRATKGRARQALSDKRAAELGKKKKSTMNVRTAVLYKKSFAVLLEESGIERYPSSTPTYLSATAPPPKEPPRMICSVCGYWGKYLCRKCAMPYCDLGCESVHDETRCERRVV